MDFMNLNQSAHGDREFGFMETRMGLRRKTVVGHWRDPAGCCTHRRVGTCGLLAGTSVQNLERRPVRRQHAPGRRHRGRQGRGADPARCLGQRLRGRTSSSKRWTSVADAEVDRLVAEYDAAYAVVPELAGRRRPAGIAARRCAHRGRAARVPRCRRSFAAFTDTFEDLGRPAAASRHRRAASDGRRLRVRRARATGRPPRSCA